MHTLLVAAVLAATAVTLANGYSLSGTIINYTAYPMTLNHLNVTAGKWVLQPAKTIAPGYQSSFATDGGFLAATSGNFVYSVATGGPQIYFNWNVPTVGASTFTPVAIPPNVVHFTPGHDSSGTTVTVSVYQGATVEVEVDSDEAKPQLK
ncbi:uncharacterized protein AMSG_08071 [Thecamonas trahens ATCC 50062]|uniref:Uncharacterized protein n=1 Tax=Thecamonas trahens ATCC 50062 TaxID=461836 RepID=A0A0L0DJN5_THETB|nr:hypothetical protein AMSG_08071 [Thecamonas trahens ATCC 50062]KNC52507.1 hypothetical protein AMSG_08071 [Thecamonas trahens ATCC 50062]|eukprot:XP_013755301.1 hypothetical protein AMSG_08071 [Thecamonas trahens ATCC 50062]